MSAPYRAKGVLRGIREPPGLPNWIGLDGHYDQDELGRLPRRGTLVKAVARPVYDFDVVIRV